MPLRTFVGAESSVELTVNELANKQLRENRFKEAQKRNKQLKTEKKIKEKTNRKYHYLYDEKTMRKEKLTQLK